MAAGVHREAELWPVLLELGGLVPHTHWDLCLISPTLPQHLHGKQASFPSPGTEPCSIASCSCHHSRQPPLPAPNAEDNSESDEAAVTTQQGAMGGSADQQVPCSSARTSSAQQQESSGAAVGHAWAAGFVTMRFCRGMYHDVWREGQAGGLPAADAVIGLNAGTLPASCLHLHMPASRWHQ